VEFASHEVTTGGELPGVHFHYGPVIPNTLPFTAPDGRQLFITNVVHLTVNANGVVTVLNVEPFSITCAK